MIIMILIMANQYSDSPGDSKQNLSSEMSIQDYLALVRTVYAHVDELHNEYRRNDHERILPWLDVWAPILPKRQLFLEKLVQRGLCTCKMTAAAVNSLAM